MIIVIICIVVFTSLFYHLIVKHKENAIEQMRSFSISEEPFSLSSYFDRIEKLHIQLLEESKNREPYQITLRFGVDVLRLNEDGTTEWIRNDPEPIKQIESLHEAGSGGAVCSTGFGMEIDSGYISEFSQLERFRAQPFYYPQYYPRFYLGWMEKSTGRDIYGHII